MGSSIDRFLAEREAQRKREPLDIQPPPPKLEPAAPVAPAPIAPLQSEIFGGARAAMAQTPKTTPAEAVRLLRLRDLTGMSTEAIKPNVDAIEATVAPQRGLPADLFIERYPRTAAWMAEDPARAALVAPDLPRYGSIGQSFRAIAAHTRRGVLNEEIQPIAEALMFSDDPALWKEAARIEQEMQALPLNEPEGAVTLALGAMAEQVPMYGGILKDNALPIGVNLTGRALSWFGKRSVVAGGVEAATVVGAPVGAVTAGAGAIAVAAGTALQAASGAALTVGVAASAGRREGAQAFLQYRRMKNPDGSPMMSLEEARGAALMVGAVNGVLETIGLSSIAKAVPALRGIIAKDAVAKLLANPTTRAAFLNYAKNVGGAMTSEGITEGMQSLVTQMGQKLGELQSDGALANFTPMEALGYLLGATEQSSFDWQDVRMSMELGAVVGGGMTASTGTLSLALDVQRAREAQAFRADVETVIDKAKKTTAAVSAPHQLAEVLGTLVSEGHENVYIDPAAFEQLFQSAVDEAGQPIDPRKVVAGILEGDEQAFDNAVAESRPIAIPIARAIATLGVNSEQTRDWLLDNLQKTPFAMSAVEARHLDAAYPERMKKIQQEVEADAEEGASRRALATEIETRVRSMLKESKRSGREQRMGASLMRGQAESLLAMGVPEAAVREMLVDRLTISRGQLAAAPAPDQTLLPEQQAAVDAAQTALAGLQEAERVATEGGVALDPAVAADGRRQALIALGEALAPPADPAIAPAPADAAVEGDPLEQADPARWTPLSEAEQELEDSLQRQRAAIIRARDYLARKGKLTAEELQALSSLEQQGVLPETIEIDGVERPTTDSTGGPIALTEAALRNFWKWFGDSKVVDEQGRPRVVYHGTTAFVNFDKFQINVEQLGVHVGVTPMQTERFTMSGDEARLHGRVYPLYVRAEKSLRLEDRGGGWNARAAGQQLVKLGIITPERLFEIAQKLSDAAQGKLLRQEIRKKGYDSVVYLNRYEGVEPMTPAAVIMRESSPDEMFQKLAPMAADSYILLDATQLKSAYGNNGDFSRKNDATMLEQAARVKPTTVEQAPVPDSVYEALGLPAAFALGTSRTFSSVREMKVALQEIAQRVSAEAGVDLSAEDASVERYLVNALLRDALHAIKTNANAMGWYDITVRKAMAVMAVIHPELRTDPKARLAFTFALAVTSNGIKVGKNFELTEDAYAVWKETGKLPTNIGMGTAKAAIDRSLAQFNDLIGAVGYEETAKFLMEKRTVKELQAMGYDVTGESVNEIVRGAAFMGPKIGNGFYANLNGAFDALTMDRWWIRMWGRLTGVLIRSRPDMVAAKETELLALLTQLEQRPEEKARFELALKGTIDLTDMQGTATLVKEASADKDTRGAFREATPLGDAIRKVSNGLWTYLDGQKEAPAGSRERQWMRRIANQTLSKLVSMGYTELEMADLQALLWYPEKRIYENAKANEATTERLRDPVAAIKKAKALAKKKIKALKDRQADILETAAANGMDADALEEFAGRQDAVLETMTARWAAMADAKAASALLEEEDQDQEDKGYDDDDAARGVAMSYGISTTEIDSAIATAVSEYEQARAERRAALGRAADAGRGTDAEGDGAGAAGRRTAGQPARESGRAPQTAAPEVLNQSAPAITAGPLWFSALERAVEKMKMPAMPANEWWSWLTGSSSKTGIRREELDALGVEEWLQLRSSGIAGVDGQRVTREEFLAYIRENGVQLAEGMTGGDVRLQQQVKELRRRAEIIEMALSDLYNAASQTDDYESRSEIAEESAALRAEEKEIGRTIVALEGEAEFAPTVFEDYSSINTAEEGSYRELGMTLPFPRGAEQWTITEETIDGGSVWVIKNPLGDRLAYEYDTRGIAERALKASGVGGGLFTVEEVRRAPKVVFRVRNRAGEIEKTLPNMSAARHYVEGQRYHTSLWEHLGHNFKIPDADRNRIAHVRFNVQRDAAGNLVLHIDEIQNDWAQAGRKRGWVNKVNAEAEAKLAELRDAIERKHDEWVTSSTAMDLALKRYLGVSHPQSALRAERQNQLRLDLDFLIKQFGNATAFAKALDGWLSTMTRWPIYLKKEVRANALTLHEYRQLQSESEALFTATKGQGEVATAPFVQNTQSWTALVLKRMIRYAAENGFDRISWTTGADQVTRYEEALRKRVDRVEWTKTKDGVHLIGSQSGTQVINTTEKETVLSDALGKAMANRILKDPAQTGVIVGKDITIDDTGMASFYDQIVPLVANKLLRQLGGGKVEAVQLRTGAQAEGTLGYTADVPAMSVPEFTALRDSVRAQVSNGGYGTGENFHKFHAVRVTHHVLGDADELMDVDGDLAPRDAINMALEKSLSALGSTREVLAEVGKLIGPIERKSNAEEKQSFVVTEQMKATAMNGLPLFQPKKAAAVGPRGRIFKYADGRMHIQLLENADESTFLHEMAHFFLAVRSELTDRADAPALLRADQETLHQWWGDNHATLKREAGQYLQTAYQITSFMGLDGVGRWVVTTPRGERLVFDTEAEAQAEGVKRRAATFKDLMGMDEAMVRAAVANRRSAPNADIEALLNIAMEEQFARGFELYLKEGKAPTVELRTLFAKFAEWLTKIYGAIDNMGVTLTPEVRAVMDRMVATEEQIEAAKTAQSDRPLFNHRMAEELVAAGFTLAQATRYVALLNEAKMAAHEDMRRELMTDITRKEAKWYKAERKKVRALVADAAYAMPVYRALSVLQRGRWPDPKSTETLPPRIKLDPEQARSLAPVTLKDGEPTSPLDGLRVLERNGMDPDIAATLLGFADGQALVTAITTAMPLQAFIEQGTEAKMKELHPEAIDPARAAEIALEAIHTNEREAVLRHEFAMLAARNLSQATGLIQKMALKVPPSTALKAMAARTLGAVRVGEVRPDLYAAAEARAARKALELSRKGDWLGAAQAKQAELFAHALFREATAFKAQLKKDRAEIRKVYRADSKLAKSHNIDLVNAARSVLARVGLGFGTGSAAEYLKPMQTYNPQEYALLVPLLETQVVERDDPKTLTVNEYTDTMVQALSFWQQARRQKQFTSRGETLDLEAVRDELHNDLLAKGKSTLAAAGLNETLTDAWSVKAGVLGGLASLKRVEAWVNMMDGGKPDGVWRRFLWEPISSAAIAFRLQRDDMATRYVELLRPLRGTLGEKVEGKEIGYTFATKKDLLGAMLHMGNRGEGSNFDKLIRGRAGWQEEQNQKRVRAGEAPLPITWTEENWDAMITRLETQGVLTREDYVFLQGVWDLIESRKSIAQQVHRALVGHYFNEVTATAIVTRFGTFRGGYFPAIVDSRVSLDAKLREDVAAADLGASIDMFPTPPRGFTKNRTVAFAAPLLMDLDLVSQHIDKQELFIHMALPVRDVNRLLHDRTLRSALEDYSPSIVTDMLRPWITRAAKQTVSFPTSGRGGAALDWISRKLRSISSMSAMLGNVVNTLQQFTGISVAAVKVRPRYLAAAALRYSRSSQALGEFVDHASAFMRSRNATQLFETRAEIENILSDPSWAGTVRELAVKHGYFMQSAAQGYIDNVVWLGAYEQNIADGGDSVSAVREADAAVRLTQGSFAPEDISRAATGNPFIRLFTMYFDYFNMQANLLGSELSIVTQQGVKQNMGRALFVVIMGFSIPAIVGEYLAAKMRKDDDLEDKDQDGWGDEYLALALRAQAKTVTAFVPIAGQAVAMAINLTNDKIYDDRLSLSPVTSIIEGAVKGTFVPAKLFTDDVISKRDIRDVLSLLSLATGVPFVPLAKPIGYAMDVQQGAARPTGPVDYARGLVTGR